MKEIDIVDIAPIAEQVITPTEPTKLEGFQEGDKVYYTNKKGNRLLTDYPYTIAKVYPKNLIRINGFSSLWSTRYFVVYNREAVPVPMQKPVVKELSLSEQLAKKRLNGLCNFAIKYEKAGVKFYVDSPCHARMASRHSYVSNDIIQAVACNVSRDYNSSQYKKEYVEFITYIIQESPWAPCFIPKPIEDVLRDGIELDVSKEINMVVAAAIALRLPHEYSYKLPIFSQSLNLGFSKTIAFLSFQFGNMEDDSIFVHCHEGGHNVISSFHQVTPLITFFKNGYKHSKNPPYSLVNYLYAIHDAIGQIREGVGSIAEGIKRSKFVKKGPVNNWGTFNMCYKGDNIMECAANMGNCFVSLGFK